MERRGCWATDHGVAESDMTQHACMHEPARAHTHTHTQSVYTGKAGGNGNVSAKLQVCHTLLRSLFYPNLNDQE